MRRERAEGDPAWARCLSLVPDSLISSSQQEPLGPSFQMKKLRFGEAKSPAQGHMARRWDFKVGLNLFSQYTSDIVLEFCLYFLHVCCF